ncbi:3-hydroxyacyl-CoA dehydrogenase NAD-binding domain-containing protein [Noviherbaspirillum sp. Root189]|uniref:3-hydroxyacyl-CoA dehydrogenase NAD-binding domain-containing protein n=1 Tax=Noviherbaspirillum sp. Root189 TaxID=1736487 RepID=UPI000708B8BA|nr:3-hydroxyacyl-CoA dehydrogenase NAD-binding domain-containing protein [Noviherbaspirillum sp. Root189]KRB67987.1 3-hydroxyacyl-CoA dehydrogenase [Noviherbaspirillum sp. Root189]
MDIPHYQRHGAVAVLRLANPPVNGLSHALRVNIAAALDAVEADPETHALVLIGEGAYFCGGADIREFNTPNSSREPVTPDLIKRIAAFPKPVIAAIHGAALGGGLELALGCHYRVAQEGARLGLPEVKLGLLPGGGGTQRLPRLIGVAPALDMIVSGQPVDAHRALQLGLVDEVAGAALAEAAIAFATRNAGQSLAQRALPDTAALPADAGALFAAARSKAEKATRGQLAPRYCIDCVEASTRGTLEEGLRFERERFVELVNGTQSKALRHLFFAEREVAKVGQYTQGAMARPVSVVGVIGAGTMGTGIAMSFANAGFQVVIVEASKEALDRGLRTMRGNYEASVAKGKLQQAQMDARLAAIRGTTATEDLASADLVIEAVFEDMEVKRSVFERLDRIAKPGAILATNTSRLDINQIAAMTSRPQDVVGLHFFSPANVMKLLEVVRGEQTAPDVIATAMEIGHKAGKVAVLVGVCDGFVGNRMVSPYTREAHFLLEEGASPQQVDQALERFGMAMGPLRMGDLAGLDISWAARKRQAPTRPAHIRYCHIADRICEAGRLGQKTGAGFYRYEPGSRTPVPDPAVQDIIERCAADSGITRRAVSDEEIVERCMYALVNEAARILEEGIADRGSDIDVIYANGYGFPSWRGGPLFHADSVGLERVLGRIREFHEVHGELWKPAPLLERLVAEGRTLSSYRKTTS